MKRKNRSFHLWLPDVLINALQEMARREETSMCRIARQALEDFTGYADGKCAYPRSESGD